jgi:hypothetical protein
MGLDIAYFTDVKSIAPPKDTEDLAEWANEDQAIRYYTLDGMEDRLEGFPEGWVTGKFAGAFRAGSYSGYSQWRSLLAHTILGVSAGEVWNNPGLFDGKPFVELINFADNEGSIGPVASAKLAKDFEEHRNDFAMAEDVLEVDLARYDNWAEAFAAAAGNGIVLFA